MIRWIFADVGVCVNLQAFSLANQQKSAIVALETKKTLQEEALNWVKARARVNTCFRCLVAQYVVFFLEGRHQVWSEPSPEVRRGHQRS